MSLSIDKIIKGDQKSILIFYKTFSPKLTKLVTNKLPENEDREAFVNDIFLEAIDSLVLLKNKDNITSWMYSIAQHKIVDYYRKKKIKSILLSKIPFFEIMDNKIHQPEFQFETKKLGENIDQTFHKISQKYQKILTLHYEENLSVKMIAKMLKLPFKATESLLFRARQSFKKAYETG